MVHIKKRLKNKQTKRMKGIEKGATVGGSKHESLKQHNE